MICQGCGIEAPTKYVSFYQNIGALVMRFHRSIKGNLCKRCINKYFWEYTLITLGLGWWGMISFFLTPFFVINNVVRYLGALGLEAPPPDATRPELTDEAIEKLNPHADELIQRLGQKEKLAEVAEDIAAVAGVTPGQVQLYIAALARSMKKRKR
jgi:hypothetical protein